jgi:endonuclease-3
MERKRASRVLETLLKTFKLPEWTNSPCKRPFETLIRTIISQNTSNKNTARAFEKLSERFPMTPEAFSNAELSEIERCLRPAGLYRNKSKIIKKLSRIIIEEFNGSLEHVLSLPTEEARKVLLGLPGIGRKTADILLLFCAKKPTVPVDTHVNRVSRRLGLAPAYGGYEKIRLALQKLYDPKDYLAIHVLLILLGRSYCKARKPLCNSCPMDNLCPHIDVED